MRKILLVLLISFSLISCGKTEQLTTTIKLEIKNGVYYEVGQIKPFTGVIKDFYKNGATRGELNYKDGKINGEVITFYKNGQIEAKGNYKEGYVDGKTIEYYKDGQIKRIAKIQNRKRNGEWITYYKNGQIEYKVNYKDGERID